MGETSGGYIFNHDMTDDLGTGIGHTGSQDPGADLLPLDDWSQAFTPGLAAVARRFYFPETWLWNTHVIG